MYGHSPPFRPGGGGQVSGVTQPSQPQQIHLNPNNFPNPNFFPLQQHPMFMLHQNPFLQNPIAFPQIPHQFSFSNVPFQINPDISNIQRPPANGSNNVNIPQQHVQSEMIEKVDAVAKRAHNELLEAGGNVSAWKVSQEALVKVGVGSWDKLGLEMQQVPSLNRLLGIEQKVDAFIHCFVAVRRITSLHDLEIAICESESIERFEELGLGPLLRHPLVVHYFSVSSDLTETCRIKTEEIISCLCEFINSRKKKEMEVDTFLDFVSEKKSVGGQENLCVRVQDFNEYIDLIQRVRQSEDRLLDKCFEEMKTTPLKKSSKPPLVSSKNTQFCGKHTRIASSSSDEDNDGGEADEYNQNRDENNIEINCGLSLPNVTSNRVSCCPYPSANEEMNRLSGSCRIRSNVGTELSKGKRKFENISSSPSLPRKMRKINKFGEDLNNKNSGNEIVTRKPICFGQADSSFMFSLVNWVLPYAQRYIYNAYPDKYFQLKQSDFKDLKHLKIFVVEKLFYRNVKKKREITSRKRHQCNCLIEDNILYCARESDTRSVFLELTSLLLGQAPEDLHLVDFLQILTTIADSGTSEELTEFYIVNSQKVPKLPSEESIWSLSPIENDKNSKLLENCLPLNGEEQKSSLLKRRPGIHSSWPPVGWKTTSGDKGNSLERSLKNSDIMLARDTNVEVDTNLSVDTADRGGRNQGSSLLSAQQQQAMVTGRLGESVAFKYFVEKVGDPFVTWVNETSETGLPYDIVLGGDESSREYVEVKATKSWMKNWFLISLKEWQFAIEKGESFSIAHVSLADENMAKVTVYKNPARLCQLGNLKLAMVVPRE